MSHRLDKQREADLQPKRMETARAAIVALGLPITYQDDVCIRFTFKEHTVSFYPYSGWATGKTITDGRGLKHLLSQLNNEQ